MGQGPSVMPVIPAIAANAPPCVDPFNASSVDECPFNSVCFPGNLAWIPKDSRFYNASGWGFCSCYTVHSVEGEDCLTIMGYGYAQLTAAFLIAIISLVAFCVTVADGAVFVQRVTRASAAYKRTLEAAERASAEHRKRHPESEREPRPPVLDAAPLSVWHWLSSDPSFSLLITSSICFVILIFVSINDIVGILNPNVLVLAGKYKVNSLLYTLAFSFAGLGVNNVSLILLGVAWIRMARKVSKKHVAVSSATNKDRRRSSRQQEQEQQQQALPQHSNNNGLPTTLIEEDLDISTSTNGCFSSVTQTKVLFIVERFLRVGLVLYPIVALVLYVYGYIIVVFAISFSIVFLMCFLFFLGSLLVRRLLQRVSNYLRRVSKRSDIKKRADRADALSRMHVTISIITLICALGIGFIVAAGGVFLVDSLRTSVQRLAGRDHPIWYRRLRMIAAYLLWVGILVCSLAISKFGRKFTQGVDMSVCFKSLQRNICSEYETYEPSGLDSSIGSVFRRSFRYLINKSSPREGDDRDLPPVASHSDPNNHREEELEAEQVERWFLNEPGRMMNPNRMERAFVFTVKEVAQPRGNNNKQSSGGTGETAPISRQATEPHPITTTTTRDRGDEERGEIPADDQLVLS